MVIYSYTMVIPIKGNILFTSTNGVDFIMGSPQKYSKITRKPPGSAPTKNMVFPDQNHGAELRKKANTQTMGIKRPG